MLKTDQVANAVELFFLPEGQPSFRETAARFLAPCELYRSGLFVSNFNPFLSISLRFGAR